MTELARGSTSDRPWGQTLAKLASHGLSGQLDVRGAGGQYSVAFSRGAIVGAASSYASDALVRIALTANLITSKQGSEIARRTAADPGRSELDILAEVAQLAADRLHDLRRRAVVHRAARTFSVDRGAFVVDDRISVAVLSDGEVDVRFVIYSGARGVLSNERLEAELARLGTWFQIKPEATADLAAYEFTEVEQRVLDRLTTGATLQDLALADPELDNRAARAIVYSLAACGACETEPRPGAKGPPVRLPSPPWLPPRAGTPTDLPTLRPAARPHGRVVEYIDLDPPTTLARAKPPIASSSRDERSRDAGDPRGASSAGASAPPRKRPASGGARAKQPADEPASPRPVPEPAKEPAKPQDGKADDLASRVVRAEEAFKQGEMALRRQQYDRAIIAFSTACELQPGEPEYQALLAWATFAAASDKQAVATVTRAALSKAVEASVDSVAGHFYLGRVERMLGREKDALAHFQEVLRIKPHHAEASSEVRILEQRLKREPNRRR
jgi:hypothetical protein